MANLENLENLEQDINDTERNVEESDQKLAEATQRLSTIEAAISQLYMDREIRESVEANKADAEAELRAVEQERDALASQLETLQGELNEMNAENDRSANVISELAGIGEDVSDAQYIIDERSSTIQANISKIHGANPGVHQGLGSLGC